MHKQYRMQNLDLEKVKIEVSINMKWRTKRNLKPNYLTFSSSNISKEGSAALKLKLRSRINKQVTSF